MVSDISAVLGYGLSHGLSGAIHHASQLSSDLLYLLPCCAGVFGVICNWVDSQVVGAFFAIYRLFHFPVYLVVASFALSFRVNLPFRVA